MLVPESNSTSLSTIERLYNEKALMAVIHKAIEQSRISTLPIYVAATLSIDPVDPLALLEQIQDKKTFRYYWEKPNDSFSMAAGGELERLQADGEHRFREASTNGKELLSRVFHYSEVDHSKTCIHLLGGFSFSEGSKSELWKAFGTSSFTLPKWHVLRDGQLSLATATVDISSLQTVDQILSALSGQLDAITFTRGNGEFVSHSQENPVFQEMNSDESSKNKWLNKIETAVDLIKNGTFKKIVLARKLRIKASHEISDTCLLNKLREQYPDCHSFLIGFEESSSFIGATPERLATFKRNHIFTEGLAGSISRGKTASEDAFLEHSLLNSKKDLNEHAFVVDAIEATLTPFSENIDHPNSPDVKKLSNVQHLYTPMTAHISENTSRTEVLKSLHPTPAVGGFPRDKAVPFIDKLEDFDRGWYAAPIGWINASGEGEFAVAIRSGLIQKKEAHFFAGCGIVEHSNPLKEWEETKLKFIPMLSALKYATQ